MRTSKYEQDRLTHHQGMRPCGDARCELCRKRFACGVQTCELKIDHDGQHGGFDSPVTNGYTLEGAPNEDHWSSTSSGPRVVRLAPGVAHDPTSPASMSLEKLRGLSPVSDVVDHPSHYTSSPSGVECITVAEHMTFNVGNAVKYLWRQGQKGDALEDLKKARWYVDREIQRLEKARTKL